MGPSRSGKSTLMHILAGLDQPTGDARSGHEIAELDDSDLTRLRREHIGFVFQFFNLLPTLTAEENIRLPLARGRETRRGVLRRADRERRPRRPPRRTALRSSRAASSSASRSRARSFPADGGLRRRADRQPRLETGAEILELLRNSVDDGQTLVMVTHEAARPRRRPHPLPRRRGDRAGRGHGRRTRSAWRWTRSPRDPGRDSRPARAQARAALTAIAVVLGVAMISGTYVLTDTIQRRSTRSSPSRAAARTPSSRRRTAFDPSAEGEAFWADARRERARDGRQVEGVEAALGGVAGEAQIVDKDGKASTIGKAPRASASPSTPQPPFKSLTLARATGRAGTRSRSTRPPTRRRASGSATHPASPPAGPA